MTRIVVSRASENLDGATIANPVRHPAAGVVVPIRSFELGKARLAQELDRDARARLGRRLASRVVEAAGELPVVIVSSAPDVRMWARERGLVTLDDPGTLDAAAAAGRRYVSSIGCRRVVIAHSDLPRIRSLAPLLRDAGQPVAVLVPCQRDDGTPVLSVPADAPFEFAYGPDSFRRHAASARAASLAVRVIRAPDLSFDLDLPDDLRAVEDAVAG